MPGFDQLQKLADGVGWFVALLVAAVAVVVIFYYRNSRAELSRAYEKADEVEKRYAALEEKHEKKIAEIEAKYEMRIERMRGQVDFAFGVADRASRQSARVVESIPAVAQISRPSEG